jgi:hypothetical protein
MSEYFSEQYIEELSTNKITAISGAIGTAVGGGVSALNYNHHIKHLESEVERLKNKIKTETDPISKPRLKIKLDKIQNDIEKLQKEGKAKYAAKYAALGGVVGAGGYRGGKEGAKLVSKGYKYTAPKVSKAAKDTYNKVGEKIEKELPGIKAKLKTLKGDVSIGLRRRIRGPGSNITPEETQDMRDVLNSIYSDGK